MRCEFEFGDNGRPIGEANVDFATHAEAVEAMKKHRAHMGKFLYLVQSFPVSPRRCHFSVNFKISGKLNPKWKKCRYEKKL